MSETRSDLKVLLLAEAANPEWVSVPLVGWLQAKALLDKTNAHLVTQIRNRDAILRAGLREGQDFTAIDSERIAAPLYKLGKSLTGGEGKGWTALTAAMSLTYYAHEYLVWKTFGDRIRAGEYDVVHRITPLTPTAPSVMAPWCKKAGVPMLIGPLNGGAPWPKGFDNLRRQESEWLSYVRGGYRLLPGHQTTRKTAAAFLIGSRHTLAQESPATRAKCFYLPENGIDPERFPEPPPRGEPGRPLKAAFVGRLVPYKGLDMLVEAAAPLVKDGALTIEVLGDGPQRPQIEADLRRLEIGSGIRMRGWVDPREVGPVLGAVDLFTFPSIREFGGGVVLEAMAMGAVPIVVDYAGPPELVSLATGFKIPMGPRTSIVSALRAQLEALVANPQPLISMREAALRRAREQFSWSAKADTIVELYRWLAKGGDRPHFPNPIPDLAPAAPSLGANMNAGATQ